ncbi:GAF domain-containing sensor histidine kinase [Salegentibacter flavus]|uniref:histidine kinase n=1 Tax=Salegentibacter flavus TaxID=287099 RepID=A0A1I4YH79_9FLAO|nr:GAF domain-containing sensor histidine kinase [Salegentibacter flavus]SFN36949.1 GAF sensor signal transduction histidine kinase [Salegentibacter flavus]
MIKTGAKQMIKPAISRNELERLASLEEAGIFNTSPEAEFDNITKLASFICKTPVSLISLVGESEQYFKSRYGTEIYGSSREISFCAHAILKPKQLMVVNDTRLDERFKDNPFTLDENNPVQFYAGMPLVDHHGFALGTLCVLDTKPNKLDKEQKIALKALAKHVEVLFELRRKNKHLEQIEKELKEHNTALKDFAGVVSHDMKMPLANMIITADILKAKYGDQLGKEGLKYLKNLKNAGLNLSDYINSLLTHYESNDTSDLKKQEFDLHHMLEEIIDLFNISDNVDINLPNENIIIQSNRAALEQIFLNLLSNSLKYNESEKIVIDIDFRQTPDFYYFSISDNGIGIPQDKQEEIFQIFTTLAVTDRKGNKGNGIGLSTVKRLVKNLGGNIKVNSQPGQGTQFTFSAKRNL